MFETKIADNNGAPILCPIWIFSSILRFQRRINKTKEMHQNSF